MIDANNTWVLWSIIVGIATISIFLENRYKWAAKISGAIIGLLMAATLSNLGVIPTDSPVYDQVWGVVVPLAIPMLLFQCDLKQIWKESGRLLAIFLISSVGTVLGAVLGYLALSKAIPVLNHIAGMMVGSYIGGGVNFVAVSSAFEIPKELISAATVADNLLMVFYFLILLMIPSIGFFKKHFKFAYTEGVKEEEEKAYALNSVDDLVDHNFMTKHGPGNGQYDPTGFGSAYVTVPITAGIYGGNTSEGAPGAMSFKHNTFRIWGYYGYEKGFLNYASNMLKAESKKAGNATLGDDFIIKKVSDNKFSTLEEWKKEYFREVVEKAKAGFNPVTIDGTTYSSYDDLKQAFSAAVDKDKATLKNGAVKFDNTVALKEKIYKKLLQQTNSFKTSIFK